MSAIRPRLHILLALALLTLSWVQLSHQTDVHAHDGNGSCELCLFAGNIQHGATATPPTPNTKPIYCYYSPRRYVSPRLEQRAHLQPRLRGPPALSIV